MITFKTAQSKPVFLCACYIYTELWPLAESLKIMWAFCGWKLARPVL